MHAALAFRPVPPAPQPLGYAALGPHDRAMARAPRRVLLVDDHELVRLGVKARYATVGCTAIDWVEAASLEDAMALYRQEGDIDAVLLDLNLADCKGLQGLRRFLGAHPEARIAVFSGTQDEFVIRQARAMGAVAYVCKGSMSDELQTVLERLVEPARQGPAPAAAPMFPRHLTPSAFDRVAELGPRHLEILELVLSGCTNAEIGHATKLSLGTVKNYVSSLLLALDVRSRSHLISLFR